MDDLADLGLDLISILHFHDEILKLAAYYKTTIYIHRPKIQDDNL